MIDSQTNKLKFAQNLFSNASNNILFLNFKEQ